MKSIRTNKDWPKTHKDLTIIGGHGTTHYTSDDYDYQIVQAGGRVIEDNSSYHHHNRFLMTGGMECMKQVNWYNWSFVTTYPNGRPTAQLIVFEYEKYKTQML